MLTEVLQHDPDNIRTLYRRGKAYLYMRNSQKAKADLDRVLIALPQDENVIKDYTQLNMLLAAEAKQQSQVFTNFFQ